MATKKAAKKVVSKKSPKALKVSGVEDLRGLIPVDLDEGLKIARETVKLTVKMVGHVDVLADASRGTQEVLSAINSGLGATLPRAVSALERIAAALEVFSKTDIALAAGPVEAPSTETSISQDFTREMASAALPEAPAFNGHGDVPPV